MYYVYEYIFVKFCWIECVLKVCICIDVKWEYFKGFVDFKCGFNFYNR